jgi:dipeptidyl aminopeptidase/acylaminoacyl peptidase
VDLHGVHDRAIYLKGAVGDDLTNYERSDLQQALGVAWASSPVESVAKWKSPVLFIHGDDDRNVLFHQTVDLVRRLDAAGVHYEELVLPDEIHGFLRHQSWVTANKAMVGFFDKVFRK